MLRQAWARLLQASGCLWWANRQLSRRGAVMVLTFHRVLDDTEFQHTCSLPGIVVRRKTFESLAGYVARKYEAVDLRRGAGEPAGKMRVMFTFDDGWKDNYSNALPVARTHGIPLTIFICPGLIGRTLPFWPEQVVAALRSGCPPASDVEAERLIETLKTCAPACRDEFIASLGERHPPPNASDQTASWEQILEMHAAGVRFGCHTHTHEILTRVPLETSRQEIREAKRTIEAMLGTCCDAFAYPNGNHSREARQILAEEGFTAAFTTKRGAWTRGGDPLAIPRVNVCEGSIAGITGRFSPVMFQYTVFWKAWRAMRPAPRVPATTRPEPVDCQAELSPGFRRP